MSASRRSEGARDDAKWTKIAKAMLGVGEGVWSEVAQCQALAASSTHIPWETARSTSRRAFEVAQEAWGAEAVARTPVAALIERGCDHRTECIQRAFSVLVRAAVVAHAQTASSWVADAQIERAVRQKAAGLMLEDMLFAITRVPWQSSPGTLGCSESSIGTAVLPAAACAALVDVGFVPTHARHADLASMQRVAVAVDRRTVNVALLLALRRMNTLARLETVDGIRERIDDAIRGLSRCTDVVARSEQDWLQRIDDRVRGEIALLQLASTRADGAAWMERDVDAAGVDAEAAHAVAVRLASAVGFAISAQRASSGFTRRIREFRASVEALDQEREERCSPASVASQTLHEFSSSLRELGDDELQRRQANAADNTAVLNDLSRVCIARVHMLRDQLSAVEALRRTAFQDALGARRSDPAPLPEINVVARISIEWRHTFASIRNAALNSSSLTTVTNDALNRQIEQKTTAHNEAQRVVREQITRECNEAIAKWAALVHKVDRVSPLRVLREFVRSTDGECDARTFAARAAEIVLAVRKRSLAAHAAPGASR
jgi:hypothetical protein